MLEVIYKIKQHCEEKLRYLIKKHGTLWMEVMEH